MPVFEHRIRTAFAVDHAALFVDRRRPLKQNRFAAKPASGLDGMSGQFQIPDNAAAGQAVEQQMQTGLPRALLLIKWIAPRQFPRSLHKSLFHPSRSQAVLLNQLSSFDAPSPTINDNQRGSAAIKIGAEKSKGREAKPSVPATRHISGGWISRLDASSGILPDLKTCLWSNRP